MLRCGCSYSDLPQHPTMGPREPSCCGQVQGLLVALAILGVLASTRQGDRYYLVLAALGAVGAAITVVRSMEGDVAFIGLFDLPAALVVFVVAAEAGLPAPVARRLGWASGVGNGNTIERCTE